MIIALLMGRAGSSGFPGKNLYPVLGRPLVEYPLIAASRSRYINKIFVSTDSPEIEQVGKKHTAAIIKRPPELCTSQALGEDVYVHAYNYAKANLHEPIELVVLLMANAATITSELIDEGIKVLNDHPEYDSAVSVSCYNMWSPLRARREGADGLLHPFVPFTAFGDPGKLNCDRDSQGDVWFADMGVSIIRPENLEHLEAGLLPQKWMGQKIYPLKQWGGLDVDYEFQIPQIEFWLKKHGY
jgi:GTP:adenosylcobinamide-phosphate guanylyltransferase